MAGHSLNEGFGKEFYRRKGTLQTEIIAILIPKTFFCVTDMRFSKKNSQTIIPCNSLNHKRSAAKQRDRERKGAPEIIQKFRLRNWPISSADFPMTPMEWDRAPFWPFLGEGFFGNIRRPLVLPAPLFYC